MALSELNDRGDAGAGCQEFLRRTDRYNAAGEPVSKVIREFTGKQAQQFKGKAEYLNTELSLLQRRFETAERGGLLTDRLVYRPTSWNPLQMMTASLAHADWLHLLGNLVFFWAFAVTAEAILGWWRFALFCIAMALGTHIVYSAATLSTPALPTLGLSGVVFAVMALTAFFLPGAPIRTVLWVIVRFFTIRVPAWFLALWYSGFDAHQLLSGAQSGGVNLVAHVSGAVLALVFGLLFYRGIKRELAARDQRRSSMRISRRPA